MFCAAELPAIVTAPKVFIDDWMTTFESEKSTP